METLRVQDETTGARGDVLLMRWFYRGKQWLYQGRRPNRIAKVLNQVQAAFASRRATTNGVVALDVVGRTSGRIISFPLVMVTVNGQRYLVSLFGDNTQWVRNVRASGRKAILRSGGREHVRLEEIPVDRRPPILKAYLQIADGARPHVPVNIDEPIEEFEKIAGTIPVFRLASVPPQ